MPYILIRGNLASYGHKYPWRVLVSGLRASDIEQLKRFPCGGYSDDSTIVYLQHPCVILTALEVLGYKVVASSSTAVKQDYNEYMWTMRKDFSEPEPGSTVTAINRRSGDEQENLDNTSKEASTLLHNKKNRNSRLFFVTMEAPPAIVPVPIMPADSTFTYVAIKGSLHAQDSAIFGLNKDEVLALSKRFSNSSTEIINGIIIKGHPIAVINSLAELGYRVISTTGEAEIVWTLQREV